MFKVNNKGTRMTSQTSFSVFIINLEYISYLSSPVFTVDFEQVNISWVPCFPLDIDVNDILNYQKNYFLRQWRRSGVFILNFKHVLHLFLLFLLSGLNK